MGKKIVRLTESDLKKIIEKVISEQGKFNYTPPPPPPAISDNTRVAGVPTAYDNWNEKYVSGPARKAHEARMKTVSCVPSLFKDAAATLKASNYNTYFMKAALGIIGRESDFGSSDRYTYLNPLKSLWANLGGSTSVGYAQVKPETAAALGIPLEDLNTAMGSLKAAIGVIIDNYEKAKSIGYTNNPSNVPNGTGNAKLDMAIIGYNLGAAKIVKYCETNDPNKKRPCSQAGKVVDGLTVTNKFVPDYIPSFKSERWDGVSITTHGYVQEVARTMKKLTCL